MHKSQNKIIKKSMENIYDEGENNFRKSYDDELMPENFEQIAKAYSKSLKNKGFVFVRLEEEEFNLLLSEVFVIISKMQACLKRLKKHLDGKVLSQKLSNAERQLEEKFGEKHSYKFECMENENSTFLSLVSLENLLTIKLMLLSAKSGELELCTGIITAISGVFAESFPCEGFRVID